MATTFREWLAEKIRGGSAAPADANSEKPAAEQPARSEAGAEAPAKTDPEPAAAAEQKPAEQASADPGAQPAVAEHTLAEKPAAAAPQDARAQFSAMVEAIGETSAAAAFASGLTLEQAVAEHHKFLKAENAELRKRLEALGSAGSPASATVTPAAEGTQKGKTFREEAKAAVEQYGKK